MADEGGRIAESTLQVIFTHPATLPIFIPIGKLIIPAAAMRFFDKAMRDNDVPEKVAMDKSGANKAALDQIIEDKEVAVIVRRVKYLNNIVEQDHRAIKRITKPMLGFQSFRSAQNVLTGIELMHMIRKGQLNIQGGGEMSFAGQFYALAGQIRPA